jgi:hypothetical protein
MEIWNPSEELGLPPDSPRPAGLPEITCILVSGFGIINGWHGNKRLPQLPNLSPLIVTLYVDPSSRTKQFTGLRCDEKFYSSA